MREKIFKYIDEHRQEMLTFWKELVSIESGTLFKEDVDRARDFFGKGIYGYRRYGDIIPV